MMIADVFGGNKLLTVYLCWVAGRDNVLHGGHISQGVTDHGEQKYTGNDCSGRRVFSDVAHLWSFQEGHNGNNDGSDTSNGLIGDDHFRAVDHHDDHAVTLLNAESLQTGGQLRRLSSNIHIGIFAHVPPVFVDDRGIGAETPTVVDGEVGESTQVNVAEP